MRLFLAWLHVAWFPATALFAFWCGGATLAQCPPPNPPAGFPAYCAATVLNSASSLAGALAPNTIASVYGNNLSTSTVALTAADLSVSGELPTQLPGTDTRVLVSGMEATPYYISPTQINFLIPPNYLPGKMTFAVMTEGRAGPLLTLELLPAAPALFLLDAQTVVATHIDGSVVTTTKPALPGEIVILWATGLGQTNPPIEPGRIPEAAAPLVSASDFQVLLDGQPAPGEDVLYAGVAPLFAGLYQINLRLPAATGLNPEIRIACAGQISPPQIHLTVQP
jgi:uncharacterized protein (TIGR03437 family)